MNHLGQAAPIGYVQPDGAVGYLPPNLPRPGNLPPGQFQGDGRDPGNQEPGAGRPGWPDGPGWSNRFGPGDPAPSQAGPGDPFGPAGPDGGGALSDWSTLPRSDYGDPYGQPGDFGALGQPQDFGQGAQPWPVTGSSDYGGSDFGSGEHRAAPADGYAKPPGKRARHAAPSLQVKVLGPVEIAGPAEQLLPKQAELILALALHAPVGVSNSGLCSLLGPDADHPRPADSVRQLITRTRKRLGQAPDGQEYIIHLGSGIYVPHGELSLDWATFSNLARRGRAERRRDDLRAAMALVRGEPFADCYHWWIDIGLVETIRAEIVDTAELLAQLDLAAGDPRAAAEAARTGLSAETSAEQLWRALMRAEYEAGNPDGVTAAWTGCLDAISEIAPGGEPHPDTEQLFHQLTRGAALGTRR